ncbi:MAG: hypothetical protein N4A48_09660 [Tepidibacter sp.]|jgi:hypothetical protein|uniref:hypothetical protein n=1 Tax=Tepidibacter sp. TaxID=2529387 RepID=UPI0025F236CC|nr:hypothetical protein [Tepidibacter sp.]MCT4509009.1 hypothetical protein [Tepidibacter sp.]
MKKRNFITYIVFLTIFAIHIFGSTNNISTGQIQKIYKKSQNQIIYTIKFNDLKMMCSKNIYSSIKKDKEYIVTYKYNVIFPNFIFIKNIKIIN